MANGKIRFGKQSGGELALIMPDGVTKTEVIFPESGELATKQYVDNNSDIGAITSYSQISGTNTIEGVELTNNIHDIFGDGSAVATYQLDNNANDLGGTYNGVATNVTYEEGKFRQAGKFNGSNSYIGTTIPNTLFDDNGVFTVSFWYKFDSISKFQMGISGVAHGAGIFRIIAGDVNNVVTMIHFESAGGDGNYDFISLSPTSRVTNGWHHITVGQTGRGNKFIYIDGVNQTDVAARNDAPLNRTFSYPFEIGRFRNFEYDSYAYSTGSIDQLRIFNRALTGAEINTLYLEAKVSANAKLNINQGTFIYPKGLTSRGYAKSSDTFTGSVPTSSISDGWKYVAKDENNNFSFYATKPTLGKTSAELYLKDGKLYNSSDDTEITPISFLSNKVRFASGIPVELAPSGIAKSVTDSVEAKEVFGKNSILAYALIDMTATPPTILDSYNVSSVIRVSNGVGKVTLEVPTDKNNVTAICSSNAGGGSVTATTKSEISFATATTNQTKTVVIVLGGKN